MKERNILLFSLLFLCILLPVSSLRAPCSAAEESELLPCPCRIVCRLEAYEGTRRTSHAVLSMQRTADAYHFSLTGAESYSFFLRPQGYVLYHRDSSGVLHNVGLTLPDGAAVERWAQKQVGFSLLQPPGAISLPQPICYIASRRCRRMELVEQSETQLVHSVFYVDEQTGLTLASRRLCTPLQGGQQHLYLTVCELFDTGAPSLPQIPPFSQ